MKNTIFLFALIALSFSVYAQSPTAPTKEVDIIGVLDESQTETTNHPDNNSQTHIFVCRPHLTVVCFTIVKPNLPVGGAIASNELPQGAIQVGELITITIPSENQPAPYSGYFQNYTYSVSPNNYMDRVHTFVLVNPN